MILEEAVPSVKQGQGAAFEISMAEARSFITAMPGFQRIELRRCIENSDQYLLLVWWDSLEAHTQGFRQSANYGKWRALLHHFYDPFPTVEHYAATLEQP